MTTLAGVSSMKSSYLSADENNHIQTILFLQRSSNCPRYLAPRTSRPSISRLSTILAVGYSSFSRPKIYTGNDGISAEIGPFGIG